MPRKDYSALNSQLKKVKGLYRQSNRKRYEQAIAEGPQAVRELVSTTRNLVRDVYATEQALARHDDIAQLVVDGDLFLHVLPTGLFESVTTTAQGILAVFDIPDETDLDSLLKHESLLVMGLATSDPGNAGTIMRSADAAGAGGVIFTQGSVECSNPKVVRASVGSYFHVPFLEDEDAVDVVLQARSYGFQILIADGAGEVSLSELEDASVFAYLKRSLASAEGSAKESLDVLLAEYIERICGNRIDLSRKTVWIFGNEAHGFTKDELKLADARVKVPMWGRAESLNVAAAASLCVYASAKAQHRER